MSSKRTSVFVGIGLAVLLAALFVYPRLVQRPDSYDGNIPCLNPSLPMLVHIHPRLKVLVDGVEEVIPSNLGLDGGCERALHMHDLTGEIHVESQIVKDYTLNDFMGLWGKSMQRDSYDLAMTVDGKPSQELGNLILKDKQEIILHYSKNQ